MIRKAPLDIGGDVIEQRTNFEKMLSARPLADDVSTTLGELGGIPVLNIETGEASHDAVMLWFHGGWCGIGSPRTSAGLSSDLVRRVDAKVISVDYRLAPEHPYPAALQDASAAYRGLLDSGVDPRSIAIVGESSRGGLAVALLASLGEDGLAQPACADPADPSISPIFADLHGVAPILIQAGSHEISLATRSDWAASPPSTTSTSHAT